MPSIEDAERIVSWNVMQCERYFNGYKAIPKDPLLAGLANEMCYHFSENARIAREIIDLYPSFSDLGNMLQRVETDFANYLGDPFWHVKLRQKPRPVKPMPI